MNMRNRKIPVLILLCLAFASCVNSRKAVYFNQAGDAVFPDTVSIPATIIQKSDLLSIIVSSANPEATAVFNINSPNYSNAPVSNAASVTAPGYLVNNEGNIDFPVLGVIKAEGLSTLQLQAKIGRSLVERKLLVDPIVSIRHLNFKVTVLGEVAHPLVINVPNEKISLLEALGLAGDISIYGKRDQVLLIREEKGQKILKHIDLSSTQILSSPYYYLRANDIVYVEPTKARVASSGRGIIILPIILSGLSFLAIVADRAFRK